MNKTKIDIISGFLGSGKTTFIKKLMEGVFPDEKIVILENEFGRINIDLETLGMAGVTVKPIQAGCICCSSSQELPKGILEIINEFRPTRIIVEPTGIAKLSELKEILKNKNLMELCELDHIITIVDGKNYFHRTMISKEFFENQIRGSEVIFLSKTEDMGEEDRFRISEEIYKIKPTCRIITEPWNIIPINQFKKLMEPREEITESTLKPHILMNLRNDYESFEFTRNEHLDIDKIKRFIQWIENNRYGEIHRLKGICTDSKQGLYSVDYVPGETVIKLLTEQQHKGGHTLLCLIGRKIEKKSLNLFFEQ